MSFLARNDLQSGQAAALSIPMKIDCYGLFAIALLIRGLGLFDGTCFVALFAAGEWQNQRLSYFGFSGLMSVLSISSPRMKQIAVADF